MFVTTNKFPHKSLHVKYKVWVLTTSDSLLMADITWQRVFLLEQRSPPTHCQLICFVSDIQRLEHTSKTLV